MSAAKDKGNALEHAVRSITEAMIRSDPTLKDAPVVVQQNKIIPKNGVSYEVDVWICFNQGTVFETAHIIECKNRKLPVGAPVIRDFVMKKNKLGAASGTIIARKFTKDARAEAANESGITLLRFADEFWAPIKSLIGSAITHDIENTRATLVFRDSSLNGTVSLSHLMTLYRFGRDIGTLGGFVKWMVDGRLRSEVPNHSEGVSQNHLLLERNFENGECFINGHEIARIVAEADYTLTIAKGRTVNIFDVEERGGFMKIDFPSGTFGQKDVSLEIVTKKSDGP